MRARRINHRLPIHVASFLAVVLVASTCAKERTGNESSATSGLPPADTIAASSTPSQAAEARGPRLTIDSATTEARLDLIDNEYVVRISPSMARVLEDSLPEFMPIQRSDFTKSVLLYAGATDTLARPLSVVVGDFDGDGKLDVTMIGTSRDTSATVMVLARPDVSSGRQLLYVHRPLRTVRTWPSETFLSLVRRGPFKVEGEVPIVIPLRADAIHFISYEQGAVLYYLDRGVIRDVITSD